MRTVTNKSSTKIKIQNYFSLGKSKKKKFLAKKNVKFALGLRSN